jgi:hypothetical protein
MSPPRPISISPPTGWRARPSGCRARKCSACSVAYVERPVYEEFLARLKDKAQALKIGNPEDKSVFVGPVIDEDAVARFERAAGTARQEGRIVHGGERLTSGGLANGYFVAPTIVADLPTTTGSTAKSCFCRSWRSTRSTAWKRVCGAATPSITV